MATKQLPDSGREFEQRALALARAIYDPSGLQGSAMLEGREHDGVFVAETAITAFEFTQLRTVDKVRGDAGKIAFALKRFGSQTENRFKSLQGFVVTLEEPTAEQRRAVKGVAQAESVQIDILSVLTLRTRLVDTESYLALRRAAPFGSAGFAVTPRPEESGMSVRYIEPHISRSSDASDVDLTDVVDSLSRGERLVLTADFGAGKSEALRQIFERMRKAYFRDAATHRFPVHLNLRDLYGLRTPREVLTRHAEEIGFGGGTGLMAAWRSGSCDLLLDGFDELVPSRWAGGVRDLRQVRWQALKPVRELVAETPPNAGILVAGRAQYFSGAQELFDCLGMAGASLLSLQDFDDEQTMAFLGDASSALPEWLPPRPLLLKFLVQANLIGAVGVEGLGQSLAWYKMLNAVAVREADRVDSLTPQSVLTLMARVATLARSGTESLGPISIADMRMAFREVCGYEPDEQGLQLLLRLPGLASGGSTPRESEDESRSFVDPAIADAAFGCDLATYIGAPYSNHPLGKPVTWTVAGSQLVSGVAAAAIEEAGFDAGIVRGAVRQRVDAAQFDAVLLDLALTSEALGASLNGQSGLFLSEIIVPYLQLEADGVLSSASFKDCVIETLDVVELPQGAPLPRFEDCVIGTVLGWSEVPAEYAGHLAGTEISTLDESAKTSDALLELPIDLRDRLGLVILRKVYAQKGKGRQAGALVRGLPLGDRASVGPVLDELVALGYLSKESRSRGEGIVLPVKGRRAEVLTILSSPEHFRWQMLLG